MKPVVLSLSDLELSFKAPGGAVPVLHGVSLHVREGERVALVGESGSGKSVSARIALGLMQHEKNAIIKGSARFLQRQIVGQKKDVLARDRGISVSMIFQDPTSALNPVYTIGTLFHEVIARTKPRISRREADGIARAALERVSISEPERVLASYVFQLSGGMNQRVMIAMALVNRPKLLIADEPGTALDVTVQARTLDIMRARAQDEGTAVLLISHNLGVVREFADRIYVIYRGKIVEQGFADQIFHNPQHPYTRMLLSAMPSLTGARSVIEQGDPMSPMVVHAGAEEPQEAQYDSFA